MFACGGWFRGGRVWVLGLAAVLLCPRAEYAYSVQTHEQLIDLTWKPSIVPLLMSRFPNLTPAQLNEAHGYAYGGSAIQDLGYYPFGNEFFSDLLHYVRTGDFIRSLLRNAKTPDELAFAIGALSHYVGDTTGHAQATNVAVGMEFPKLAAKYGRSVTYDENPHAHVQVEFAFDVNEISKHRFAPSAYLAKAGLGVSMDLLGRAFFETYGLRLKDEIGSGKRPRMKAYNFGVRRFLPRIAYAETVLHRHSMPDDVQDEEYWKLENALAAVSMDDKWDLYRKHAGIGTYSLAGLIFVLPKFGPLAMLKIKGPSSAGEQDYVKSVNNSVTRMNKVLVELKAGDLATVMNDLPNRDLDTGLRSAPGTYRRTDLTYAKLLGQITAPDHGIKVPTGLRDDIQGYYADAKAPNAAKKDEQTWAKVQTDLVTLKTVPTVAEP
ncbi:zinc dependent phospholipase C family protein [Granulicella tundricola]|uniref:Phospholipase C/D domain-containing protein n=1 Tax=Granulicella tundricola (strain ATCC BAA-1859 / DSM 23138 / MP5ACTX9) TaxID=1198114 RepID=E8WYX1_GRATM|nr:zinc dependent phospholipase C family protein [Granulicella tundricola]ADW68807.1 hypothetical protein AciX9_1759 [Granulicella tundricola MP5ACTX9]